MPVASLVNNFHPKTDPCKTDRPAFAIFVGDPACLGVLTFKIESESEVAQSCLTLCDPMDSSLHQAPPSMGFSSREYWSGLPFPSPGNLPAPGIDLRSSAL